MANRPRLVDIWNDFYGKFILMDFIMLRLKDKLADIWCNEGYTIDVRALHCH
jgi:hypothetical protein